MRLDFLLNLMNKLNKTDSAAFKFRRSSLFLKFQFFQIHVLFLLA